VDGSTAVIGQKVDAATATVMVDKIRLPVRPDGAYYLMFKPAGVISTTSDERGRRTVIDLVPKDPAVYPVGRLDADSEGLLILTNDGDLTHHLTHPSFGVTKTYTVLVDGRPSPGEVKQLENGVELEDGPAHAESARIVDVGAAGTLLELVMSEGRNREVRRMIAAIGHTVLRLVRTAIGDLRDRNLKPGSWRLLTAPEVRRLFAAGGGSGQFGSWENAPDRELEDE